MNLGIDYEGLSEISDKKLYLGKAIEFYKQAEQVFNQPQYHYELATVRLNLANAYAGYSEIEDASSYLDKALSQYKEALKEFTIEN